MIEVDLLQADQELPSFEDDADWFEVWATDTETNIALYIIADLTAPPYHWDLEQLWLPRHHWSDYKWGNLEDSEINGILGTHLASEHIEEILNAPVTNWRWS